MKKCKVIAAIKMFDNKQLYLIPNMIRFPGRVKFNLKKTESHFNGEQTYCRNWLLDKLSKNNLGQNLEKKILK